MNNKGASGIMIGTIIVLAISAIVGLVLLQSSAQQTDASLTTRTIYNRTYTAPAANGVIDLIGQELLDTPIVTNATSGVAIPSTNYTIAEGVSTVDGLKRIRLTTTGACCIAGKTINITYTYGGEGYIDDAGGRSVYGLVILLGSLAIAVFVVGYVIKDVVEDII